MSGIQSVDDFRNPFFIGIAGTGMSAIAQYLAGIGKTVSGSDRFFREGETHDIRTKLEAEGIRCFPQNGDGITPDTDVAIVSSAIEDTVVEVQKGRQLGIPVLRRSELLAMIARHKRTIAVGGTSGKSTTTAMLFDILHHAGWSPSIISGAGLVSLIRQGKIGNAYVGSGEWLVIEADESDGSIVQYHAETGVLLNIDKDHKDLAELVDIFTIFKNNSRRFVVNRSHQLSARLSQDLSQDFSIDESEAGYRAQGFVQEGMQISFFINDVPFRLQLVGRHNMENAAAAAAVADQLGLQLAISSQALAGYQGIYRRHQVLGEKKGVILIDDYAHNPVKCAAVVQACQPIAPKVVAWFQPHGYGPTKFLRADFVDEFSKVLRDTDEIWMSEIFYAGGTAVKDISAEDLVKDLRQKGKNAFFVSDRKHLLHQVRSHLIPPCVMLLMGARDPSLEEFAATIWNDL